MGEQCNKYWLQSQKASFEAEPILALKDQQGSLCTKTEEMTTIASAHHEKLQTAPDMSLERQRAITNLLTTQTTKLDNKQTNSKDEPFDVDEIKKPCPLYPMENALKVLAFPLNSGNTGNQKDLKAKPKKITMMMKNKKIRTNHILKNWIF